MSLNILLALSIRIVLDCRFQNYQATKKFKLSIALEFTIELAIIFIHYYGFVLLYI